MKLHADTKSYIQLCMHTDGDSLYLMVPTYYDATEKVWAGFVKTPNTKKMITGTGKSSKELEQNFNDELRKAFQSEISDEVFALFKPLSYWDEMMEQDG